MNHFDVILTCNYSPWSSYSGGGQRSTHFIATALTAKGYKVCVVYSKAFWERIPHPKVPYQIKWALFFAFKPGISSPLRFLNGLSYYRLIKKISHKNTTIHSNGEEGSLLGFLSQKKSFFITNRYPRFRSFLLQSDWSRWQTWIRIFFKEPRFIAYALAFKKAEKISCTSTYSMQHVIDCFHFTQNKITFIPNGLDPIFIERGYVYQQQTSLLFFGRLTHAKGVDLLLKAYIELPVVLKQKHPLLIIGHGPYQKKLIELVSTFKLEKFVSFKNWLDGKEIVHQLHQCRLAILPSREESFGNTMLETLATGTPLITSNRGSIPEVIGTFGTQIDPENLSEFTTALQNELKKEPDSFTIEQQREWAKKQYSWERTADRFLQWYALE